MPNSCLWLEVSNVRTESVVKLEAQEKTPPECKTEERPAPPNAEDKGKAEVQVQVQLKGDRGDKEPTWWKVKDSAYGKDASETARDIFRAMDSKRVVLAGIEAAPKSESKPDEPGFELVVGCIRIQFSDSGSR